MDKIVRIAIDGPSGAGKSTVAKLLADRLGIDYIDTGAMYRAVGYKILKEKIDINDENAIRRLLGDTDIDFSDGKIFLDGEIINDFIRTSEISKEASACSTIGSVRSKLVKLQRDMGLRKSVIMDGRDIGTNVLKDAEYKFFITASPEERANRRYKELRKKGQDVIYEQILKDIIQRDHNDSTRKINPLKRAEDAILVDTTKMTIEEVIDFICEEMR